MLIVNKKCSLFALYICFILFSLFCYFFALFFASSTGLVLGLGVRTDVLYVIHGELNLALGIVIIYV